MVDRIIIGWLYLYPKYWLRSIDMTKSPKPAYRGPMIHIRLDEETHKQLRRHVAQKGITIQAIVEGLVRREIGGFRKQKK